MNTLQGASYAGLSFICWEILTTLDDEVALMWPQTRKLTIVKILYFFVRYLALAIQIINAVAANILRNRYPLPRKTCQLWLGYQTFTIYLLLSAVDMILMIRVYAFYNRRRWIGIFLATLLICKFIFSSAGAILTIPDQRYNASCLQVNNSDPSLGMYCFIMGELLIQSIVAVLTLYQHFVAVRGGWARTPLVSLLFRGGASAYTIIVAILIGILMYANLGHLHESAHVVFPAIVSILSCVGCRLIISMQKLIIPARSSRGRSYAQDSQQLTSIISSVWTSPLPF
ncbi:hypothetical protein BJ912DRAFT_947749 [Pholiota molesta]|nr:hypothetical protein BJ912DRAFT_947749 [Pholiota molesta]